MKITKVLSLLLCAVLTVSLLSVTAFADATTKVNFEMPYCIAAPVFDGVIADGEWEGALVRVLTADNVSDPTNSGLVCQGGTFYWMWDETGLYFAADVVDKSPMADYITTGNGSYNAKDGIQVNIFPDDTVAGSTAGTLLFFSFVPTTTDGTPALGEHFCYGTGSAGADVPAGEGAIAATYSKTGYVIEGWISAASLAKMTPALKIADGVSVPLANIIMDIDGSTQALFTDTAWFSGIDSNKYVLTTAKTAGLVEVEDDEEEAAAADTAAAAAEAPKAAKTADAAVVLAIVGILGSGVVVTKKRG